MLRRMLSLFAIAGVALALTISATRSADAFTVVSLNLELNCWGVIDLGTYVTADRDNTGMGWEAYTIRATDGYGNVILEVTGSIPFGTYRLGSDSWAIAPLANPLTLQFISLAGNGFSKQLVFSVTGECVGLPFVGPEPEPVVLPGCDVLLPIPATAVGGTFVADAPVYWAPGKLTNPLVTIAAGNSARVIGLDSTGEYYQIIWVCDYVWVPRASLGPNYDAVWNGAPLPTAVVE